jgi:hypothetical protein
MFVLSAYALRHSTVLSTKSDHDFPYRTAKSGLMSIYAPLPHQIMPELHPAHPPQIRLLKGGHRSAATAQAHTDNP